MYGSWTEYAVLWTNSLGFIWDIKRFYGVYLLSLIAKSTFKIIFLCGYVLKIGFKKCKQNSTVNLLVA